ncbi:hypothetical protein F441_10542 [Phytophthora nicotianae CJ01A1]|uniref:CDP-diacylglycerol--glycerol-3-phosphate 3-phosphatidyltransferase n=4 Tax=Phytophthora nicotianae TaxID=4792 RepID=W2GQY1_PHYNI|nr:hypothetical protein L915_10358 [Phytophthora nicotianae]ETM44562.1 hypothetical protein L914_10219 [Phytophthora nicotianae]ETO73351.1 hypothetical protein F444_10699 [Phytophthora nicotianae P1976]ETP14534.1 hypothetical protein F441_10542 [Phytophthora nicotianae CJ01A1]
MASPCAMTSECSSTSYEHLFRSLARHSRLFPLRSSDVALLATPTDFYQQLVHNIQHAETRISISSLYLGTGQLERDLVDALATRLKERPQLQVQIVLDYSRGQRGGVTASSVTMLAPLLKQFPNNVELFLFRVPQLSGLKAKLPPPFNETLGVSHAKVYLVDDTLVLSGANLSNDYFTNRQDRYVQLTSCGALAQFYHQFVELVTGFSYKVKLDSLTSDKNDYELLAPVLAHDSEKAKTAMRRDLEKLVDSSKYQQDKDDELTDAWAFPTLQFTPISMDHDERVLSEFVRHLPRGSQLQIASGYLNFPPFLSELLERCEAGLDVISAAPRANGFYDARGVKGALPMAYSLIEQDFFERTLGREFPTVLREFNRLGWTFHGKGMWWRPPPPAVTNGHQSAVGLPQLTVVGSSNFGQRSYGCDLESNLVLFTRNADLQQRLQDEYDALTRDAEVVTEQLWRRPERMLHGLFSWKDGHWIRPVSKFIAAYL